PCSTSAHTAPVIATTEPTERSTPPVAITSVMPSESSMMREPCVRMSIGVPKRWPFSTVILRNAGLNAAFSATSAISPTAGQNIGEPVSRLVMMPSRHQAHQPLRRDLAAGDFAGELALAQHEHARAVAHDLLDLRGNQQ